MENYKEYLEERMAGMYNAYDSVLLEGYFENQFYDKTNMHRESFIRFLEKKYPDFDRSEIENAKTQEEVEAVEKKYLKDFKQWAELKDSGYSAIVNYAGSWLGGVALPIGLIFNILYWREGIKWIRAKYKLGKEKKALRKNK